MTFKVSFFSETANVLYSTAPDPVRHELENKVLAKVGAYIESMTSTQIFRHAPRIDGAFKYLSGRNVLALARIIEQRAPAAMGNMPMLRLHRDHLRNSMETAQVLAGLPALISALKSARQEMGYNTGHSGGLNNV
jgi:hypothetical protein